MKAQFMQLLQKVTHFSQNCNFLLIPPDQSHAGEIAPLTRISVHKRKVQAFCADVVIVAIVPVSLQDTEAVMDSDEGV